MVLRARSMKIDQSASTLRKEYSARRSCSSALRGARMNRVAARSASSTLTVAAIAAATIATVAQTFDVASIKLNRYDADR